MPQRPKRWSATARTDEGLRQMFLAACLCTRSKLNKAPQLACSALRWQHTSTPGYVPVVVVGAGPTGLVLSCLLSQYGVRHMILERSKQLTQHPQAHYINNRTMEVFRSIPGLSHAVAAASPPLDQWRRFIYCEGMAVGQILGEVDHFPGHSSPANPAVSPEPVTHLSQHRLLPLLLEQAQQLSAAHGNTAEIQFGKSVTTVSNLDLPHRSSPASSQAGLPARDMQPLQAQQQTQQQQQQQQQQEFSQLPQKQQQQQHAAPSENPVTQQYPVCIGVQSSDGSTQLVRCSYLAAADGANSTVRSHLGIQMSGDPSLQHLMSVHFIWPALGQALLAAGRAAMLYFVFNMKLVAVVVAHDLQKGEFVAQVPYYPPLQSPADFTPEFCQHIIAAAAGWPPDQLQQEQAASSNNGNGSGFQLCTVKDWVMSALVADEFAVSNNRVVLVGDSAHRFPPAGGFGMNTGIQDAHNLAWKLAAVLSGSASQSLMNSYQPERQPIARANTSLSINNWQEALRVPQALGLDPKAANLVNQLVSNAPLPSMLGRWVLDTAMAAGRGLAAAVTPLRRSALQHVLSSGQSLRLQFPLEDLGFVYQHGAIALPGADPSNTAERSSSNSRSSPFVPCVVAGGRLPHCRLLLRDAQGNTQQMSTLDLATPNVLGINILLICSGSSSSERGSSHPAADYVPADWLSAGQELQHSGWPIQLLQVLSRGVAMAHRVGAVESTNGGRAVNSSSMNCGTDGTLRDHSNASLERTAIKQKQQPWRQPTVLQAVDVDGTWARLNPETSSVALLVRPDGHVAWRSSSTSIKSSTSTDENSLVEELQHVLVHVLCLLPPEHADAGTDAAAV